MFLAGAMKSTAKAKANTTVGRSSSSAPTTPTPTTTATANSAGLKNRRYEGEHPIEIPDAIVKS